MKGYELLCRFAADINETAPIDRQEGYLLEGMVLPTSGCGRKSPMLLLGRKVVLVARQRVAA
jgi:hypothetical protein